MPSDDRPNILLILADAAQAHVMGPYGGNASTPAADRLAKEGVCFTQAYTTAPICHPARASIASGLLPHAHGFLANRCGAGAYPFRLLPGVDTLPEALARAGYRCGYAGQGHIDLAGFHDDRSIPTAQYVADLRSRGLAERPEPGRAVPGGGRLALAQEDARDAQFAAAAEKLLEEYAALDSPWFIQCDFDGPHPPCYPPAPFDEMHLPSEAAPPANLRDPLEDKPVALAASRRAQGVERWTEQDWRVFLALYYGMVSFIDSLVGRVLDKLEETGQADQTLVVFTSDHGGLCGAHGFLMHGGPEMFREVMRVPLLARWPARLPAGEACDAMVSHVDIAPTLARAAGADLAGALHGRSWLGLASGDAAAERPDAVLGQYHGSGVAFHSARMLRTERWAYVWRPFAGEEAYDLLADPHEMENLAGRSTAGPVVWELRRRLGEEMRRVGDPLAEHGLWRSLVGE